MGEGGEEGIRVPWEELEEDENLTVFHQGKPFTGVALDLVNGFLRGEMTYKDGRQEGLTLDRYETGQLRSSEQYLGGGPHGLHLEWHPSGHVAKVAWYEWRICVVEQRFDDDGRPAGTWLVSQDAKALAALRERRMRHEQG